MKKLLYLLLALPLAFFATSCNDDDNLPDVDVTFTFDNAVVKDGVVYVNQDSTLSITNIQTKSVGSDKAALIANIRYFWNGFPAPGLTWSNFPIEIPMPQMPLVSEGYNVLGMNASILQVDKSMAFTYFRIPIATVADESSFPDGLTPGEATYTFTTAQKKTE